MKIPMQKSMLGINMLWKGIRFYPSYILSSNIKYVSYWGIHIGVGVCAP